MAVVQMVQITIRELSVRLAIIPILQIEKIEAKARRQFSARGSKVSTVFWYRNEKKPLAQARNN